MAGASYDTPEWLRRLEAVECRGCSVICERVVAPGHCLKSGCRYIYAINDHDATFFGCIQNVYSAELDLAPYRTTPRADLYGVLRARRAPLPECRTSVEKAYTVDYTWRGCVNPQFLQSPHELTAEAVRRIVDGPDVIDA